MSESAYASIIERIFFDRYSDGDTEIEFDREELVTAAAALGVTLPKNLGDVIYTFRHRRSLPERILATQKDGGEWVISGAGAARYRFRMVPVSRIEPRDDLPGIDIPDATPELIRLYRLNDEQALLAIVRYNRLIDIFLGLTAYSLQNHLRTQVRGIGQIEIDEIYVGIDRNGRRYAIPIQAKGGSDRISSVQVEQDIRYVRQQFPDMKCRAIAAQFLPDETVALFELTMRNGAVEVVEERHYRFVPAGEMQADD
ncbi:MAG: endonuclease [Gammaproteobacteria bacterium AqS3]|nr:endonuclease [Gammaproteobacteria bacterium AqS3]